MPTGVRPAALSLRRVLPPLLIGVFLINCSGYGSGASPTPGATLVIRAASTSGVPVRSGASGTIVAVTPPPSLTGTPGAPPRQSIILSPRQMQAVTTMRSIISAYNAGQLGAVLALVSDDVRWVDCDYGQRPPVARVVDGKTALALWLGQRLADHDYLEIGQVELGGRDGLTMGLTLRRRTSDTIRALGFSDGIAPLVSAKVIFDYNSDTVTGQPRTEPPRGLLTIFGNASDGAWAQSSCRPVAVR